MVRESQLRVHAGKDEWAGRGAHRSKRPYTDVGEMASQSPVASDTQARVTIATKNCERGENKRGFRSGVSGCEFGKDRRDVRSQRRGVLSAEPVAVSLAESVVPVPASTGAP